MIDQVKKLANEMQAAKKADEKAFVLLLGAGASLSSGVPSTVSIMAELLRGSGDSGQGGDLQRRFDQFWKGTSDTARRTFLEPYLKRSPSVGYKKLAELIRAGYFDVVLTFNFDQLLEDALHEADFDDHRDYRRVVRGETNESEMQKLVNAKSPPCKLVKLHGSLDSADYFLFDAAEMHRYPPAIESLVNELTGRNIVVCGYAFNDLCVLRSFAERGDSIFCVNPGGVPRVLDTFLANRRSQDNEIKMDFDTFFTALHEALLAPAPAVDEKPRSNPFKFLESYHEEDAASFQERDEEIASFFKYLDRNPPPQVIVITGQSKAGKTSLVRAGLIPRLDEVKYRKVYIRCRPDIETHLPNDLAALGLVPHGLDLPTALAALADSSPGRHVMLFLDEFDRVVSRAKLQTRQGQKELGEFLRTRFFAGLRDGLTLVFVGTNVGEQNLGGLLSQECTMNELREGAVNCLPFEKQHVVKIVQSLATAAGIEFDARIIEDIATRFEQSQTEAPERRFTLAHVHAICHVLAGTRHVGYDSYRGAFDQSLDALHQAINVVEFMSFAEDRDYPISAWFRNMLKVPLRESKEKIAEFIKAHYEELEPPRDRRSITLTDHPIATAGGGPSPGDREIVPRNDQPSVGAGAARLDRGRETPAEQPSAGAGV